MLPGHTVTCCFDGTWDVKSMQSSAQGCQIQTECLDPNVWDPEDPLALANFCMQKCTPGWPASTKKAPLWMDWQGSPGTWFDACSALADFPAPLNNRVVAENACNPTTPAVEPYSEQLEIPPTHETTFSSASSQTNVDISVIGNELTAAFALDVEFALHECDRDGVDGGSCTLVLSFLDMATTSPMLVGDYWAIDGALTLNARVAAEVSFTPCSRGVCTGTFTFSDTDANPIGVNLFWTQRSLVTSSIDDAALHLSNGGGGLGGLEDLTGVLELDVSGEYGTLRLVGGGSDSFGGDWATVDFDILGDVAPL